MKMDLTDAAPLFEELAATLKKRLKLVADHELRERDPQTQLQELRTAAVHLGRLVERLPADCDPALRHYLERQSYVKALDWLETHAGQS